MSHVVYRAHYGNDLEAALRILSEAGLHPFTLDSGDPLMRLIACGTYKYRVAVPDEEAEAGEAAVKAWTEATAPRARTLGKEFQRDVAEACLAAAVTALVASLVVGSFERVPWGIVAGVGFLTLLLVGRIHDWLERRPPE